MQEFSVKQVHVFEGNHLLYTPPKIPIKNRVYCRLLGRDRGDQEVPIPLDEELFSRHLLFLGGIGAGKTNAIFQLLDQIRKSMRLNDMMVIFDTKGDYYKAFYRPGDIVISNDEKATSADGPDYWNIFREVGFDNSLEENILEITRTLFFEKIKHSNQPFFPNAARDLLSGILLNICRSDSVDKVSNAHLRVLLDRATPTEIRNLLQGHNDLRAMVSYIADDRSPQTQGVISELQQMVREIFVGNFRKPGSISIREAIRKKGGRAIFIEYDLGIGNMLMPIYRLILDLAIKEALCRKKSEGNVWFIIDEFRLLPNLQHIDDGVNFGRSLGAKFIIGVQNVEQVFHAYTESLARSILSGFLSTIAFHVNDPTTRDYIQGLFGKNRKIDSFTSRISHKGLYEQVHDANVVEAWDIANLQTGEAIIGLPGQEPFIYKFLPYEQVVLMSQPGHS